MARPMGIRELRADLAAQVRRAAAGQRIIVTVGGRPAATLGPPTPTDRDGQTLDVLVASGLVVAPRRPGLAPRAAPVPIWSGVRLDRALGELPRVTTFFDTSAVVAVHVAAREHDVASAALDEATCVSVLALTEALAVIDRLTDEPVLRADLEDAVRLQWDRYFVVPVDQRCLDRAAALFREQPIRLADAIHLAAASRLPTPVRYVTFDPVQIPAALGLGFDVVST